MTDDHDVSRCPNCSSIVTGEYCSTCGQRQVDLDRPLREVVTEGLSSLLAFDARLLRTLGPLVRRPGLLTREFLDGRRARYVHPFKLYVALSLVFFFVFSHSGYSIIHTNEPGIVAITTNGAPSAAESGDVTARGDHAVELGYTESDSAAISEFFAPLEEMAEAEPERFNRLFIDRLSKSLIVLVPIVALLLQLLYWRPTYVAHLVFSLHLHAFSFLVLVLGALVDAAAGVAGAAGSSTGNNVATVAILVYAFLALRRVHGQGRIVTFGKLLALVLGYAVALVLTMLGTLIVTVAGL